MGIRIRRWSDGSEYEVPSLEAFNRLYGKGYYIFTGEHATHTPSGLPLDPQTPEPEQATPQVPRIPTPTTKRSRKKAVNAKHPPVELPTEPDAADAGNEPS